MTAELTELWLDFADVSLGSYAPTYDAMVRAAANDPDMMALVASAADDAKLPNNLQAAAHYLLADLPEHPLAAIYRGESTNDPGSAFRDLVLGHRDEILELLATRKVQTNEVRRATGIAPSLGLIGDRAGRPIALVDAGCSAGLNLLVDQYRIDYTTSAMGPATSPVTVSADLLGKAPPTTTLDIGWRRGFDRNPIDVTDPDQARWLRSLVWPDHPERLVRLGAAIDLFTTHTPDIVQAEAVEGVRHAIADAPPGLMVVVVTSWVCFYFPDDVRAAFDDAIAAADRPVCWLSIEMPGVVDGLDGGPPPNVGTDPSLIGLVTTQPGKAQTREALGWTHGHGGWLDWRADPAEVPPR